MDKFQRGLQVCITGDIDYFDTETTECLQSYFDVLKRHAVPATFFITAGAAEKYPERVGFILRNGYDVQGHGDIHKGFHEPVPEQTARLEGMKQVFLDLFSLHIEGFRAPWYRHNPDTYLALRGAGLKYDCSVKRFEIAFKGIPYIQRHYMEAKGYRLVKPILRCIGGLYNTYHHVKRGPYFIIPSLLEIPTLGISDYSLIGDPAGPRYGPGSSRKIGDVWMECLGELERHGGGTLNIQAHPGRISPLHVQGLDSFITRASRRGAAFTSPGEILRQVSGHSIEA